MNVHIAGEDRTAALADRLQALAGLPPRAAPPARVTAHAALSLRDARDTADFLDRFVWLLSLRPVVAVDYFRATGRSRVATVLRTWWQSLRWRLVRFQHEKMAYQRNILNELLIRSLAFEREQHRRELAALHARIAALEQRQAGREAP